MKIKLEYEQANSNLGSFSVRCVDCGKKLLFSHECQKEPEVISMPTDEGKSLNNWQLCPKCEGSGYKRRLIIKEWVSRGFPSGCDYESVPCLICNGTGIISTLTARPPEDVSKQKERTHCHVARGGFARCIFCNELIVFQIKETAK